MIGGGRHAGRRQLAGHLFGALAREAVDDAGLVVVLAQEREQLLGRLALVDDRVADVGPVEAGDEDRRCVEAEASAHVGARLRVGRRRAGHDRHVGEQLAQPPELHVLGPEVVAPLRDAVRLVDREQGDAGGGAGAGTPARPASVGDLAQTRQCRGGHEPFGRRVEQVELAGVQLRQHAARLDLASDEL